MAGTTFSSTLENQVAGGGLPVQEEPPNTCFHKQEWMEIVAAMNVLAVCDSQCHILCNNVLGRWHCERLCHQAEQTGEDSRSEVALIIIFGRKRWSAESSNTNVILRIACWSMLERKQYLHQQAFASFPLFWLLFLFDRGLLYNALLLVHTHHFEPFAQCWITRTFLFVLEWFHIFSSAI